MDIDDLLATAVRQRPAVHFSTADVVRRGRRRALRRRACAAASAVVVSGAMVGLLAGIVPAEHAGPRKPAVVASPGHPSRHPDPPTSTTTLADLPALIARLGHFTWTHVETTSAPDGASVVDAEVSGVLTSVNAQRVSGQDLRVRVYRSSAASRIPRTCAEAFYFLVAGTCRTETLPGGSTLVSGKAATARSPSGVAEVVVANADGAGADLLLNRSGASQVASPTPSMIWSEPARIALAETLARLRVVRR